MATYLGATAENLHILTGGAGGTSLALSTLSFLDAINSMSGSSTTTTDVAHQPPVSDTELFVTAVIPVRNEAGFIEPTLAGLLQQDYPTAALEIIVVDGASTDRTTEIVKRFIARDGRIRLLANPRRWSSAGRNLGIQAARGDVVLVVDGHCEFEDDQYLRNLADALQRTGADCLGRPQPLDINDGTLLQQAIAIARSSRLGHHPDSFIYAAHEQWVPAHSVGVVYRRSVFETVGLFDEKFDACEDVEFNHRVDKSGLRCLLTPGIRLRYHPRGSLGGLFRQMARYGRGRVRLCRKHIDTFSLKSFLPGCFVLFLLLGAAASLCWPEVAWLYAGVLCCYAGLVLLYSLALSLQHRNPRLLPLLTAVFLAVHIGAGYGSLRELFLGSSPPVSSLDR